MTEGAAISRGLLFAIVAPPDSDAHYAGKGLKRTSAKARFLVQADRVAEVPGCLDAISPTDDAIKLPMSPGRSAQGGLDQAEADIG